MRVRSRIIYIFDGFDVVVGCYCGSSLMRTSNEISVYYYYIVDLHLKLCCTLKREHTQYIVCATAAEFLSLFHILLTCIGIAAGFFRL